MAMPRRLCYSDTAMQLTPETLEAELSETDSLADPLNNGTKRASKAELRRDDMHSTHGDRVDEPWLDEAESRDPSNRDPVTGRLLPGHSIPGPGRPQGALDFMAVCRKKSREAGVKLSDLVWAATRGLAVRAARGDAAAAKVLLDRLCGSVDKGTEVNVDARTVALATATPPADDGDFAAWVAGVNRVAAQQGLLGSSTPTEVVEAALAEVELLS